MTTKRGPEVRSRIGEGQYSAACRELEAVIQGLDRLIRLKQNEKSGLVKMTAGQNAALERLKHRVEKNLLVNVKSKP